MRIPNQLDIIWIHVEPHSGKEIGGHNLDNPNRPVLVVSKHEFNEIGLMECLPLTSHNHMKPPFNKMLIPIRTKFNKAHGYIIPFELLCYDYQSRKSEKGQLLDKLDVSEWPEIKNYIDHIFE